MINKISISEEFLRSQDPSLLAPLFSGVNAEYAAVLMFKSLNQMRISQMAKDALAKAVADARQYFPGFNFERVPYYWLISKSKAKNSAVQILDKSGNEKSILIMRQIKSGDTLIGYDYIDLETGKLIYARSPEGIDSVVNGLKRLRNSKLAKLEYINDKSNLLIGEKEGYERNEQLKKYQRGDVSNLIPAESMLKKCEKILDERIKRLESAIAYYNNESRKIPPEAFKTVENIVDQKLAKQTYELKNYIDSKTNETKGDIISIIKGDRDRDKNWKVKVVNILKREKLAKPQELKILAELIR